MEANDIEVKETTLASKKLQVDDAKELLKAASKVVVMKGKKVDEYKAVDQGAAEAMLGPTGNLRAPTIKRGKTLLVGFNEDIFNQTLG